ncbi:MAG: ABC transporter substrate-binding protein [Treponema sp.]|jgi:ABC-type glycerol-3-phosphate transport system substrate-binding protein|nr:ABC transporter substrate-binding protein [Treponema sp.]
MKKSMCMVFFTALFVFSFVSHAYAKGQGASGKPGGVTLSLYGNADDAAKPYMQRVFKAWEEKTGNRIDIQGLDGSNAEAVLLTKFTTGDIPDLFMHFGNYHLLNFKVEDNFYDFSGASWVGDIEDAVLPQARVNGKVYGLPFWEASVSGLFYNKRIFERLRLSIPKTQAEFETLCDRLLASGVQPIYYPTADSWSLLYQYALDPVFDSSEGERLLARLNNNEIRYADIPQITSMLQYFRRAAQKGYFGKTFMSDRWDYMNEVLGEGEAAMVYCWDTWFDTDYDSTSYTYTKDDFGLMPVFMGTSDNGTFEGPNVSLMMANRNSPRLAAALDLIDFMSKPENYNMAFNGVATNPVFKGQNTNSPSAQYREIKDLVDRVGHASVAQPKIIGYSQVQGGKIIQDMMSGNINIEECIRQLDEDRINTLRSFAQ